MDNNELQAKLRELDEKVKASMCGMEHSKSTAAVPEGDFAVCFGGGGGKGAYEAGVIKALAKYDMFKRIKAVSGASIGALNSMLYNMQDPELPEKVWKDIKFETVFEADPSLMFNGKPGFFNRKGLVDILNRYIDLDKFYAGNISTYINTTVISDGAKKENYYKLNDLPKDEIIDLLCAASALPFLYELVTYENQEMVDGGLSNNIPVEVLYHNGYRHIIVVGCGRKNAKDLSGYKDADFIEIYPSVYLGDLIDGTLNYSQKDILFRIELGYRDALRALKLYFTDDPCYKEQLPLLEQNDLNEIKAKFRYMDISDRVSDNMKNLTDMISKYDK